MSFPPRSLKFANKIIIGLQRIGLPIGTMHLITVPGRKSGQPRTTPVSPLTVDGHRYIIGGYAKGDWVKNARAAGSAVLSRGRKQERVRLVEIPEQERVPVLRAFPREVPHGVPMFVKTGVVPDATPDGFASAAPNVAVFRIESA
ncbi:nitroreductase family deazaflavin-dependent oxidoreductase [Actinoplanes sp. RD1]|uniref:nitroreductase family deazaflavin-dependent oxidoreductase n=1 Tax=Actinoplanes sp. RD1 TaxID=3064538 RepID=UPI0027422B06|nr:nitroreductase family deazaflavin-dependent oxidoreductase [Actinoplanes sp. RD1]